MPAPWEPDGGLFKMKSAARSHCVVVRPSQINVGGNCARIEDFQKVFSRCFYQFSEANRIKRLVLDSVFSTFASVACFRGNDLLHDMLPCPSCQRGIGVLQIHLRNLKIHGGLFERLILDVENPSRSRLVPCFETFLSAGRVILNEKNPAVPLEESVSSFHRHSHGSRMPDVGEFTLANTGRFSRDGARF